MGLWSRKKKACFIHCISFMIEPVVRTTPTVDVVKGYQTILKCSYSTSVQSVTWLKADTSGKNAQRIIATIHFTNGTAEKSGCGYNAGRFDITNNFSLILKEAVMEDDGRHRCEVLDSKTSALRSNHTDLTVIGLYHSFTLYEPVLRQLPTG